MELCRVPQEEEYVSLAAMHYYIQFGPACNREALQQAVEECIAPALIERRGRTEWVDLVRSARSQVRRRCLAWAAASGDTPPPTCATAVQAPERRRETVKAELVDSARQTWCLNFSRFYDVTMASGESRYWGLLFESGFANSGFRSICIAGPPLKTSSFVVAINWRGVVFLEGKDKKLLEMPYLEIMRVCSR